MQTSMQSNSYLTTIIAVKQQAVRPDQCGKCLTFLRIHPQCTHSELEKKKINITYDGEIQAERLVILIRQRLI